MITAPLRSEQNRTEVSSATLLYITGLAVELVNGRVIQFDDSSHDSAFLKC